MRYPDRWLRLISYPVLGVFIRLFGDMAPLGDLLKRPLFYADVVWDILIVAASWEANRWLIRYLDQRYSWVTDKFKRFVIQFFTALPMTFLIVIPMIYLWNEVLTDHGGFNTANLLVNDFPLTVVFTTMIHMAYTFLYFYQHHEKTIAQLKARIQELETSVAGVASAKDLNKASGFRELLVVNYGTSSVPVHTNEIAYIYKQNEISFIKTFDNKEYTSSSSLEQLETLLDPVSFFRLNRQFIGNLKAIRQFKSDASGKLTLDIHPAVEEEVTVSKKKAAEFKAWIGRQV
ncbi:MAG: LytTR family transcriptional regulator [Cyclobacteriaceae bacterium]|nr:LytTR family transcriptional regulator [Cyclobacteriaceae bacterium]